MYSQWIKLQEIGGSADRRLEFELHSRYVIMITVDVSGRCQLSRGNATYSEISLPALIDRNLHQLPPCRL